MTATNVFSTKSDVAYVELRRLILSGALPPGSRLSQYELAASLGMSITPLREAIRRLSSEHLVDLDTHRDARVARMSAVEARQLFEVRLSLDPSAAELAAARRTDDDIVAMRAAAARLLPVTREWGDDALTAHREFHRTLYLASHNDVLIRLLDDLWDKSDRYRRVGLELPPGDEPRTRDLREHHQLVALVIDGDAAGATRLMREHIERSLTASAIAALEKREAQPAPEHPAAG
ncbi:GntR family transcriptional regulator [Pseudonocardia sp. DSM 110487]|uniref:GntR family transcriptional regulator n=1 Tax=Pseudonocardia sp. DSM 110487 TaxID=2865833 RepID=UPI001C695040|nr:GntR family transcriptional regulator [Pseudonocardia sp. DSM 110487]QYN33841.1 GntR family transcriptional regulator [Pseudonocardia sp. DSM 110487]